MKHKHHIIPKHVGGSDDPSNIADLTVVHKAASAKGGRAQKGFKKHRHSNGDFKMAMPGSERSAQLIKEGYII